MKRIFFIACFLFVALTVCAPSVQAATPHPIKHSTPHVQLSIKFGRIFFNPNHVTCSHLSKPCFILTYISNDGLRPIWLDALTEYDLHTGQSVPLTFQRPSIHKITLFQYSLWAKVLVSVS